MADDLEQAIRDRDKAIWALMDQLRWRKFPDEKPEWYAPPVLAKLNMKLGIPGVVTTLWLLEQDDEYLWLPIPPLPEVNDE